MRPRSLKLWAAAVLLVAASACSSASDVTVEPRSVAEVGSILTNSGEDGYGDDIFDLLACRRLAAGEWEFDFSAAPEGILEYPFTFVMGFVFYGDDFIVPEGFYEVTLASEGTFTVPIRAADFPNAPALVGEVGFTCGAAGRSVDNAELAFDTVDSSFPDIEITED